jgi:hypothetical protein
MALLRLPLAPPSCTCLGRWRLCWTLRGTISQAAFEVYPIEFVGRARRRTGWASLMCIICERQIIRCEKRTGWEQLAPRWPRNWRVGSHAAWAWEWRNYEKSSSANRNGSIRLFYAHILCFDQTSYRGLFTEVMAAYEYLRLEGNISFLPTKIQCYRIHVHILEDTVQLMV